MDSLIPRELENGALQLKVVSTLASVIPDTAQYTVISPLLFLTYINDIPETATSSETNLYASDSSLFRSINRQADRKLLQRALISPENWENK